MPTAVSTSVTDMLRHTGANDLAGCEPVGQRSSIGTLLEARHGSDNKVVGVKPVSRKVA